MNRNCVTTDLAERQRRWSPSGLRLTKSGTSGDTKIPTPLELKKKRSRTPPTPWPWVPRSAEMYADVGS